MNELLSFGNSLLVGAFTLLGIVFTQYLTWKRDRKAKEFDLLCARDNERRVFQKDNLLNLQSVLQKYARATTSIHLHDLQKAYETGHWGRSQLDESLNQELHNVDIELLLITERIIDEELRLKIEELRKSSLFVTMARSKEDSELGLRQFTDLAKSAIALLGKILRELL